MADALNPDQMQAFLARADEGPVAMLNLLAFKPDGGFESYMEYASAVAPLLARVGGTARYAGRGAERLLGTDADQWDVVLVVEYPKRQALIDMISSPEYQAIQHLRDNALTRSVLLATDPIDM